MDEIATNLTANVSSFFSGFTGDMFFILILAGIGIAYGIFLGKRYVLNVLIGIYIAYAIVNSVPVLWLGAYNPIRALIFVFIVVFFARFSPPLFNMHNIWQAHKVIWKVLVMCILEVGLMFSIVFPYLPGEAVAYVPVGSDIYFSTPIAQFVWISLPLLVLFILNRNRSVD